jgi:hypothetical protein
MNKPLVEDCYIIKASDLPSLGWKGKGEMNAGTDNHSLVTLGLRVGTFANRNLTSVTLSYPTGDGQMARERFIVEATCKAASPGRRNPEFSLIIST